MLAALHEFLERSVLAEALHRLGARGGDGGDERGALAQGGAGALVDPGLAEGLLRQRQRDGGRAVTCEGGGEGGDLGLELAGEGQEPVEAGEVAGPARLGETGESAERGRVLAPLRARAARRMRSEKRIAAATAR